MSTDNSSGLGDDQGTRVGSPTASPASHSDSPPDRPERTTGAGAEATRPTSGTADLHDKEHRGGYGGSAGEPVTPSDKRH
ncbi:MAG: hypothetical protein JWN53_2328 [Gemmatimonadetes bacterium]|jgi:hypothetical protein|nr:hypothetical protein [Gemmatimonadota bacterium]